MWDTKYRPLKFSDVLGQDGNVQLLKSRLKNGTAFDTSYIFSGQFGRGKTTLSRIHARAMLCQDLDTSDPEPCNQCDNCTTILADQPGAFVERDAASQGTVDHIRSIVDELAYVLVNAPKRICLFDEAHRMSIAAQDVLLKPLEEKKMVGMFCTTEASKIRGAIRSRCEEYTIRKVSREALLGRMRMVLEKEGVEGQDDAILIAIDHSGGHVRDVLNKLEMVSQLGPVTVDNVREYLHLSSITLYYQILLSLGDPVRSVDLIDQVCDQAAPEEVAAGLAEAAMNSYRVAHGMHVDFAFVDRELAGQAYKKYGDDIIRFSYWFLNSKYPSRLSLTRDVVVFSQNVGNLPSKAPQAPVVFSGAQGVSTPAPAVEAPPEVAGAVVQPVSAVPETPEKPEPPKNPADDPIYVDETFTDLDRQAMALPLPRTRRDNTRSLKPKIKISHDMTPREWRNKFETLWREKSPG